MAYSNSRQTIRRHLYDDLPILGFVGSADSVSTTTVTDTFAFQDTNLPPNHFKGCYIYRPNLTTDDRVKKAGTLNQTTGVLSHTGTNYANTADLVYEIVGLIHPDELNACITRAMRKIYFETQVPLTIVTDGDMSDSTTSSWTGTNLTVHSKTTTAANVFSGLRSLQITGDTGGGNSQSGSIDVTAEDGPIFVSATVKAVTGTMRLQIWDVTNSASIAYIETTERNWQHLYLRATVPTNCERIAIRLVAVATGDDGYWDYAIAYRLNDLRILAPSWVDDPWKFLKLREAQYMKQVNNTPTTGTGTAVGGGQHEAASRKLADWFTPRSFTLDPFHPEANPFAIQLQRQLPSSSELWIEGKRSFFDLEPLATESAVTTAPLELILAYSRLELGKILVKRYPQDPRFVQLLAEASKETEAEYMSRPEIPQQPVRMNTRGRI